MLYLCRLKFESVWDCENIVFCICVSTFIMALKCGVCTANTPFSHIHKLQILNNKLLTIAQDCTI